MTTFKRKDTISKKLESDDLKVHTGIRKSWSEDKRKKKTSSTIQNIIFPDRFIDHDTQENQYKEIGMDADSIEQKILSMIASKKII